MIYYKNYINASLAVELNSAPDSTAIKFSTSAGVICIACVYRSPSLSTSQNDILISSLRDI